VKQLYSSGLRKSADLMLRKIVWLLLLHVMQLQWLCMWAQMRLIAGFPSMMKTSHLQHLALRTP
jgi:hypothetical protein